MSRHDIEPIPANDRQIIAAATSIARELIRHIRRIETATDEFEREWAISCAMISARVASEHYPKALKLNDPKAPKPHELEKTNNDTTNEK